MISAAIAAGVVVVFYLISFLYSVIVSGYEIKDAQALVSEIINWFLSSFTLGVLAAQIKEIIILLVFVDNKVINNGYPVLLAFTLLQYFPYQLTIISS